MDAMPLVKLVEALAQKSERYEKLKKRFSEFCVSSALLAAQDYPVLGVGHIPDLPNNKLGVEFCGKKYEFVFAVDATAKGVVTCKLLTGDEPIDVGLFTFVGTGDTDVRNENDDVLRMQNAGDAAHLVLHMIHLAAA